MSLYHFIWVLYGTYQAKIETTLFNSRLNKLNNTQAYRAASVLITPCEAVIILWYLVKQMKTNMIVVSMKLRCLNMSENMRTYLRWHGTRALQDLSERRLQGVRKRPCLFFFTLSVRYDLMMALSALPTFYNVSELYTAIQCVSHTDESPTSWGVTSRPIRLQLQASH